MPGIGHGWWASLRHGGLLISPSKLEELYPDEPPAFAARIVDNLRRAYTRLDAAGDADGLSSATVLSTVLEQMCGLDATAGTWQRGADVGREWSLKAMSGEVVRPRAVWSGQHDSHLPVFVDADVKRLGIGHGRRSTSRVVEWLRGRDEKVALLTNLREWRLIYAGLDHDAWTEWDTALWFEEGEPGPQLVALRVLLSPRSLTRPATDQPSPLLAAIQATRKGQAELSAELGERVRCAVEALIQEHGGPLGTLVNGGQASLRDVYIAATRVVMRMVIILFAEARDLLPRDNPVYHGSYGLQGLREALERTGGAQAKERLRHRYGSWPRIIALFRLVYHGSHHAALPVPRYGGELFRPGAHDADTPIRRVLAVFEDVQHAPSDAVVNQILHYLCRSRVRVRQGRGSSLIEAPVDFSDLSSEYIGILYEGLLDFELRQASLDDPMVFLGLGDEPALPLSRLEGMTDAELRGLVEKLRAKATSADEDKDEDEDEDEVGAQRAVPLPDADVGAQRAVPLPDADVGAQRAVPLVAASDTLVPNGDPRNDVFRRATAWATRAIDAGKLIPKPRSKSAVALDQHTTAVAALAASLVPRIVLPGHWFLVRWGGTRKGSGTFYTRPQLAIPTVQRTLRPLAFNPPLGADGNPNEDAPGNLWTPKTPDQILALKVCDPAMGSGSFMVATLRFLTDALYRSLHEHGRLRANDDRTIVTLAAGKPSTGDLGEEYLPCRLDDVDFEARLKARLKRHVVERCVYGVDLDALAVELARLSLWVETMDRDLPFDFLDHKLKCGNALVGSWLDRFRDYPILAWEREAGDKGHNGVHFGNGAGTKAIRAKRATVKGELADLLVHERQIDLPYAGQSPEQVHDDAFAAIESMHNRRVHEVDEKEQIYRERIVNSVALRQLKRSMDAWCAIWFWPADKLDLAPTPKTLGQLSAESKRVVDEVAEERRFLHWEIEFPDVFTSERAGFDGIVGNPPWEIQKPSSKEFFSNIDPLYRTYGKQEALAKQREYFGNSAIEHDWLAYCEKFKALSNWCRNTGSPFGDGSNDGMTFSFGRGGELLHERWRERRAERKTYADPEHPFLHQGSADINTYKLFLEQAHALLVKGGQFGLIVPSGVYTDKGSHDLRELFLDRSAIRFLYSFQNERFVFQQIHHSFKQVLLFVEKLGETRPFRAIFRVGPGDSPEANEVEEDVSKPTRGVMFTNQLVARFSPRTRSLLEIRSQRDQEVLEKIYANAVLLGDDSPNGWGITYAREFDMTGDSKLFPPRPAWEAKGYKPDQYGRWIGPDGDVALPLYEGRLFNSFDFSASEWLSGKGLSARWQTVPWPKQTVGPQYLIAEASVFESARFVPSPKVAYRNIARSTDTRSFIATVLVRDPTPHMTSNLVPQRATDAWCLAAALNSTVFDFVTRTRLAGTHLDYHLVSELPLPDHRKLTRVAGRALVLANPHIRYSPEWLLFRHGHVLGLSLGRVAWKRNWAVTLTERIRRRAELDAVTAAAYGLDTADVSWIHQQCDIPRDVLSTKEFTRTLNPVGFWRVDKDKDPELRHTVLTQIAFNDLQNMIDAHGGDRDKGIEAFCSQNDGDGWMLPETVRLADYDLGHDQRAREHQPVASRLGPRFYDWQLTQSVEESWAECERHARNILGEERFAKLQAELKGEVVAEPGKPKKGRKGQGELFNWDERKGQGDLFEDTED